MFINSERFRNLDEKIVENKLDKDSKDNAFNLIFWDFFSRCKLPNLHPKIVFCGKVMPDGLGDYKTILKLSNLVLKHFPSASVELIILNHNEKKLEIPIKKRLSGSIFRDAIPIEEVEKIANASLVFCGPVNIPSLERTMQKLKERAIAICEYDFRDSNSNHGCSREILTGLGEDAIGIFFEKKLQDCDWPDIQNEKLKKEYFFRTDSLSQSLVEEYKQSHHFFFCYSGEASSSIFCIHASIVGENKDPKKHIDICCPAKKNIFRIEDLIKCQNEKLKEVGTVKIIQYRDNKIEEHAIVISPDCDKEMRIIDVGSIQFKDFKSLVSMSENIVGGTGDHSLSTILSQEKILLYEGFLSHKRPLLRNLVNLAKIKFGEESAFYNYMNGSVFNEDFELTKDQLNSSSDIEANARQYSQFLRNNYSLKPIFKGIVNEFFHSQLDPNLKELKEKLYEKFTNNDLSLREVHSSLQQNFLASLQDEMSV